MHAEQLFLSVVVVFHDMLREAPRTLHSLSRAYQRGIEDLAYEVVALDNGSSEALPAELVTSFGPEFRLETLDLDSPSPVGALNHGARVARGEHLMLCIDGARILSPGLLRESVRAMRCAPRAVAATLGLHLGPAPQDVSVQQGYDQDTEDRLLESCHWREDGYRLFEVASLGHSSRGGWFQTPWESNALTLSRDFYEELGGFEERFQSPGGGLANLDLFRRACEHEHSQLVVLLGEASFHQLHGGVATNAPAGHHPWESFQREYEGIRGERYERPEVEPLYLGHMPDSALPLLRSSLEATLQRSSMGKEPRSLGGVRAVLRRLWPGQHDRA